MERVHGTDRNPLWHGLYRLTNMLLGESEVAKEIAANSSLASIKEAYGPHTLRCGTDIATSAHRQAWTLAQTLAPLRDPPLLWSSARVAWLCGSLGDRFVVSLCSRLNAETKLALYDATKVRSYKLRSCTLFNVNLVRSVTNKCVDLQLTRCCLGAEWQSSTCCRC